MRYARRKANLVLGGGGVKGIAYIGVFNAMERRGYLPGNIAGVSAGALAGSFAAAGYDSGGMWNEMDKFEFDKIQVEKLKEKVPAVKRFIEYARMNKIYQGPYGRNTVLTFLSPYSAVRSPDFFQKHGRSEDMGELQRGIISSILTFCREGCLFDGDLLEEWVRRTLARKGVRTFADLRGGLADKTNPRGYKARMTGVDCTRMKVVVMPDDMEYYGIDPDGFEVAKAVRISTAVPFAFKPVEIAKREGDVSNIFNLADGGVLDSFPDWLIGSSGVPAAGFRLDAGENKLFSLDTPLAILKGLVSSVHDIGAPLKSDGALKHVGRIDTTKVSFLDFGLDENEKRYLYDAGKSTAMELFDRI